MVYIALKVVYRKDGKDVSLDWRKEMNLEDLRHLENIAEQFLAEVSNVFVAKEMDGIV